MQLNYTLKLNHMLKKSIISFTMIGIVALALASSGGGGTKKKSILRPEFTPVRTSNGFTIRSGIAYSGSQILSTQRNRNCMTFNTLVTYQKGNTVYILPNQYRVNTGKPTFRSNLNLLDLKIKLKK